MNPYILAVALFGFAMMMEFNFNLSGRADEAAGLFYALCAMLCYAAFILVNRMINERVHVLTRSGYQMLAGGALIIASGVVQAAWSQREARAHESGPQYQREVPGLD